MDTTKLILSDPAIQPTPDVLQKALGESYIVFTDLSTILTSEHNLSMDWKYYRDSKAWLCKVAAKKKTIFWLSAWDGFFKTSFFFLERHLEGLAKLETSEECYILEKEWGKMIPLIFSITSSTQINDLLKIIVYKKGCK